VKNLSFFDEKKSEPRCVVQKYKLLLVKEQSYLYNNQLKNVNSAVEFLKKHLLLHCEPEEVFTVICLDLQLNVTAVFEVARGTINTALVSTHEIFKRVLLTNCNSIIIAHNHPGGSERPSMDDINTTKRIKEAAQLLDIKLNDHIIITENAYFSFAEAGIL